MPTIDGNRNNNNLTGTDGADKIRGRAGDDTLFGGAGNDTLNAGSGNDLIFVGLGNDRVNGGNGVDKVVFSGSRDDYTIVDLGSGRVRVIGEDGNNWVKNVEAFEFADMTQSFAELLTPREPNLTAGILAVSDTSLAPGEASEVSFDLTSTGSANVGETQYELVVASAPDVASILSVLDNQTAAALGAGESATLTASIPADQLAPGTYWVAVRVDANVSVTETDETDNLTDWVQITVEEPRPDLAVTTSVAADSDLDLGDGGATINVDYDVSNVGTSNGGSYRVYSVLSADNNISAFDRLLGEVTGTIGAGETVTGQISATVGDDWADGQWYVLTAVEWTDGTVDAAPEDNADLEYITLLPTVADLELNAATLDSNTDLDLTNGGRIEITYDWANVGTATPSYYSIRSYLSTDMDVSEDDRAILGVTGGTVTGQTSSVTTSHYFPADLEPGDYYIISEIVWGDGSDDPTDNNRIVQQVTFEGPDVDLAIEAVTLNASADLLLDDDGIRILADVDVVNLGGIETTSIVSAWLSTDTSITGDDVRISPGSITVGVNGNETIAIDALINDDLVPGDYTLIVALTSPDDNASNSIFFTDLTLDGVVAPPGVNGTAGDDLLMGTDDGEVINALDGDDTVIASDGFDTVDGGTGTDVIDFSGETGGIQIMSDFNSDAVLNREDPQTGGLLQTYMNFEGVIGTDGDDLIALFSTDVDFDFVLGGGSDLVAASDGNDTIDLGAGDDLVTGGKGDDIITLGAGADLVGFTRYAVDPFPSGDGNDRITDFDEGEDVIVFQIVSGTTYDPLADAVQTAEGALINYISGSSVLLEDVDVSHLSGANFIFDDSIYVFA